jgi:hypothetical protein
MSKTSYDSGLKALPLNIKRDKFGREVLCLLGKALSHDQLVCMTQVVKVRSYDIWNKLHLANAKTEECLEKLGLDNLEYFLISVLEEEANDEKLSILFEFHNVMLHTF